MSEPELTYEEAREQLVAVVAQLESGQVPLSESMALWERGATGLALGYVATSVVFSLAAVTAGLSIGRGIFA